MNDKTQQIISFLDDFLTKTKRETIGAVEANALLAEARILNDSSERPGLPLRRMLRAGKLPHAYQVGVRWQIPHSKKE